MGGGRRISSGNRGTDHLSKLFSVPFLATLPAESLQLETDAPWLPPQPWRGQRNEPAYARCTAEHIAALRGDSLEALAAIWAKEFQSLFGVTLTEAFWATELRSCDPPLEARRGRSRAHE